MIRSPQPHRQTDFLTAMVAVVGFALALTLVIQANLLA